MDFVAPHFDNRETYTGPTAEVMVLSTPHAGAEAVCSLLYNNGIGTPHEYFQPYHSLPALARQVGLAEITSDNMHRITAFLKMKRSRGGWFSYNLHASHHGIWRTFRPSLDAAEMLDGSVLLYCRRGDLMAQTAACYIAHRIEIGMNTTADEELAGLLQTFDEDLCVRLHQVLLRQRTMADQIFDQEQRRFREVQVLNQEDTWSERCRQIAQVLPIHDARIPPVSVRTDLKQLVLEQMRSSEAVLEVSDGPR